MFFVETGDTLRPELASQLDIVMHGAGSWVPAPPTRTPKGRIRWETPPGLTKWRLPGAYQVQQALVAYLRPAVRPPTFAARTPRFGRAA